MKINPVGLSKNRTISPHSAQLALRVSSKCELASQPEARGAGAHQRCHVVSVLRGAAAASPARRQVGPAVGAAHGRILLRGAAAVRRTQRGVYQARAVPVDRRD